MLKSVGENTSTIGYGHGISRRAVSSGQLYQIETTSLIKKQNHSREQSERQYTSL